MTKPDARRTVLGDNSESIRDPFAMDIIFVDIETTGLAPEWHDILEIGIVRAKQPGLEIVREYQTKVRMTHPDRAHPKALEVNGYSAEAWTQAVSLHEAMQEVWKMVQQTALCAHKSGFDEYFLYHALKRCGLLRPDQPAPWFYVFDTLSNAQMLLRGIAPRLRGKLLAEALGLPPEPEPHTALNGARQCYQMYKRQRQLVDDPVVAARFHQLVSSFHTT